MQKDDTQIYSDQSGYKGSIGGAAVLLKTSQALQYKLGKETCHTVFGGELARILLVLHLIS